MYTYFLGELQWISELKIEELREFEKEKIKPDVRAFIVFDEDEKYRKNYFGITNGYSSPDSYETIECITNPLSGSLSDELIELLRQNKLSGLNIKRWKAQKIEDKTKESALQFTNSKIEIYDGKKRAHILGLGDVGSVLSIGLKLLGAETIHSIGIFDLNKHQRRRYEMEINQIIVNPQIIVDEIEESQLFDCDIFVFCASRYVPKVGEQVGDVRMIQFKDNSEIIELYAKQARNVNFKGLFFVVSDPVDLLCKSVYEASNRNSSGEWDGCGISAERIRGFGLGVMHGRSLYYARKLGLAYEENGRVFGPHGKDLICVDDIYSYNNDDSLLLTEKVVAANLEVRNEGFKPYIAPALSSGAASIVAALSGNWHFSATSIGGTFFGAYNRQAPSGIEYEENKLDELLISRIKHSYNRLEDLWRELKY